MKMMKYLLRPSRKAGFVVAALSWKKAIAVPYVAKNGSPILGIFWRYVMNEDIIKNRLLTIEETAEVLKISPKSIRNQTGRRAKRRFPIKPVRLGRLVRFRVGDVVSFIEGL